MHPRTIRAAFYAQLIKARTLDDLKSLLSLQARYEAACSDGTTLPTEAAETLAEYVAKFNRANSWKAS